MLTRIFPMYRSVWIAPLLAALFVHSAAAARPSVSELVEKLRTSSDFRLRVQAALELGKTEPGRALLPLVVALEDKHASVRTAAAAALKVLGDPEALHALEQHRYDSSEPARKQIQQAIDSLRSARPKDEPKPQLLVKLAPVRNGTRVKSPSIERTILAESRKKLDELPGIDVLPSDDAISTRAEREDVPVVLVTTSIQKLSAVRDGDSIVYSANIEYLVHTMPDETIAARVAGSASTSATEQDAKNKSKSAELRREVVEAAVKSALRRASGALLAAARL